MMMVIVILMAFKGAHRDFDHLHVRSSSPGAIVFKSRAAHLALFTCNMSCCVPRCTKGKLSIKFDRVEIAFIFALIYGLNH